MKPLVVEAEEVAAHVLGGLVGQVDAAGLVPVGPLPERPPWRRVGELGEFVGGVREDLLQRWNVEGARRARLTAVVAHAFRFETGANLPFAP